MKQLFRDARRVQSLAAPYVAEIIDQFLARAELLGIAPIIQIEQLGVEVGLSDKAIKEFLERPIDHYRDVTIPKKRGGYRKLYVPKPALKSVQQYILKNIISKIPSHSSAHAYEKNRSIITNATEHLHLNHLAKIDLKNFFDGIKKDKVTDIFTSIGYPFYLSQQLAQLCVFSGALPQGAPTSPKLANLACFELDTELHSHCSTRGLVYTRYSDDIFISGEQISQNEFAQLKTIVRKYGFQANLDKCRLHHRRSRRIIAGISISDGKVRLPKNSKREIRKAAHFLIRNGFYNEIKNIDPIDPLYADRILGRLQFWRMVEPDNRFPPSAIEKIQSKLIAAPTKTPDDSSSTE